MSTAGHGPAAGGGHGSGHGTTPSSPTGTGYLYMIPILFVVFIVFRYLFFAGDSKNSNNNNNSEQTAPSRYIKTIPVSYGPVYGKTYYLPSGYDYYFDGATEPYCYTNGNLVACGEKEEDATGNFGNDRANKKLRFKSQNGKQGNLEIVLTKQQNN